MLLNFEKPKKARDTETHNKMHSADCDVAGVYVPNMSEEDNERWKCKHIKGSNERIEIRRWIGGVNLVIFVYKDKFVHPMGDRPEYIYCGKEGHKKRNEEISEWNKLNKGNHEDFKMSMNGSMQLDFKDWEEITQMVQEARNYMKIAK